VEGRSNTNTSITICTYKYIPKIFPKVVVLEESKEGGKEGKNDRK
jgi:hypothetical protein